MKKNIVIIALILLCFISSSICTVYAYNPLTAGITQISLLKSYKDISRNFLCINKMNNMAKKLSDDDKNTITKYVFGAVKGENTYLLMNCNLRNNLEQYINPKDITVPLKSRMTYYSDSLSYSISKIKLPQNMILYRGIDEKGVSSIFASQDVKDLIYQPVSQENALKLKSKLIGAKYEEKGFMSTAYDINYAKQTKFIFVVKAPKNLQGVLVDGLTASKSSTKEVLVNKGYIWQVTDVTPVINRNYYKIGIKLVL